ncbi:MAG: 2-isopropylmalate synthase [Spirochaetaceae bacterium]|jgi:2-isopropylmalate synthase|nr:2-isopropylmalate synthase [Spirochaetaceae bacterium]
MAKYKPSERVTISDRKWPDNRIEKAPVWCSVDLRDGNQALASPLTVEQKLSFFDLLVKIGFRQIEVGFPSASPTEYEFIRRLIDEKRIPADVVIQVLCQAREPLIRTTMEAIKGAPAAIFHMYNSTSPAQRKYTFNKTKDEIRDIAVEGVKLVRKHLALAGNTPVRLEYSPESFSATEPEYAVEICQAVMDVWYPEGAPKGPRSVEGKIILNLPSTVESASPNVYADQIEYFCRHIRDRDSAVISLHTHNDRGTGVAAAELGLLAGAERVEGTLFGNGERTGNLDILNLAMNLFSEGVETGLDFSDIRGVTRIYTELTGMPVHPRHPYAGELVFTAFSGSHQDAIRKAFARRKAEAKENPGAELLWDVPYLLIDPKDVDREYEEIIRINSQSGKGGAAWVLEQEYGIFMPRAMQPVFGAAVTASADSSGRELSAGEIFALFERNWLKPANAALSVTDIAETHLDNSEVSCRATVNWQGRNCFIGGKGNGPLDAFVRALGDALRETGVPEFTVTAFHEHSVGSGSSTDAMAYVEITLADGRTFWGCGRSSNVGRAGISAVVSAVNNVV